MWPQSGHRCSHTRNTSIKQNKDKDKNPGEARRELAAEQMVNRENKTVHHIPIYEERHEAKTQRQNAREREGNDKRNKATSIPQRRPKPQTQTQAQAQPQNSKANPKSQTMTEERKVALITGITGQDGSYLAELLLSKGYTVSNNWSRMGVGGKEKGRGDLSVIFAVAAALLFVDVVEKNCSQ